jgi:Xaa-Pro dipeptidase
MNDTASPGLDELFQDHLRIVEQRFAKALEACGYDAALLSSGAAPPIFRDDNHYPFRVHATFKAWVPLTDVPESFVYAKSGDKPVLLLHQPPDYWYKPAATPRGYWTRHFDIRPVPDLEAARAALPADLSRTAFVGDPFAELSHWKVGKVNPDDLLRKLDYERAAKTPYELECMRRANRLGARGHRAAAQAFAAGASEFEIQLEYLRACGLREQELPYNAIIAINEGAAVLHYQVLERERPAQRHSLLIDAGADFAGYASDITRTYSHSDADFAALIGGMDELQQALCASVHAGVDWRDVHLSAHRLVGELLHEASIVHCDADEAVDRGITSVFLPHGIGHLLGLQVHDVGGFAASAEGGEIPKPSGHPYLRLTRVLEPGFVVTMEPGIYFIDQLLADARGDRRSDAINWPRVEGLRKFGGIRIEDNLAVTESGCENLTREAFRQESLKPEA